MAPNRFLVILLCKMTFILGHTVYSRANKVYAMLSEDSIDCIAKIYGKHIESVQNYSLVMWTEVMLLMNSYRYMQPAEETLEANTSDNPTFIWLVRAANKHSTMISIFKDALYVKSKPCI